VIELILLFISKKRGVIKPLSSFVKFLIIT